MTDSQINDLDLTKECNSIAQEIFDEMLTGMSDDETPEHYADEMSNRVHEHVDGHQWVIYHYQAHTLCLHCNTDQGEEFLEDVGMPKPVTYDNLATAIAYGEMRARIDAKLFELANNWVEAAAA